MGRQWRLCGACDGEGGVLVTPLLVLVSRRVVGVCEVLLGVDDDEVLGADAGIRKVCAEALVEGRQDGIVGRVDRRRALGAHELTQVARRGAGAGRSTGDGVVVVEAEEKTTAVGRLALDTAVSAAASAGRVPCQRPFQLTAYSPLPRLLLSFLTSNANLGY